MLKVWVQELRKNLDNRSTQFQYHLELHLGQLSQTLFQLVVINQHLVLEEQVNLPD